ARDLGLQIFDLLVEIADQLLAVGDGFVLLLHGVALDPLGRVPGLLRGVLGGGLANGRSGVGQERAEGDDEDFNDDASIHGVLLSGGLEWGAAPGASGFAAGRAGAPGAAGSGRAVPA